MKCLVLFYFPFKNQKSVLKTHRNKVYWNRDVVVVQKGGNISENLLAASCLLPLFICPFNTFTNFHSIMIVDKVLVFILYLKTLDFCINGAKILVFYDK